MEKQLITGNEPAMPTIESINHGGDLVETRTEAAGLTKREHFAALAMQGLWQSTSDQNYDNYARIAEMAVSQADALIAELNK